MSVTTSNRSPSGEENSEIAQLKVDLNREIAEYKNAKSLYQSIIREHSEYKQEIFKLEDKISTLNKEISNKDNTISRLQNELQKAQQDSQKTISKLNKKIENTTQKYKTLMSNSNNEINELKLKYDNEIKHNKELFDKDLAQQKELLQEMEIKYKSMIEQCKDELKKSIEKSQNSKENSFINVLFARMSDQSNCQITPTIESKVKSYVERDDMSGNGNGRSSSGGSDRSGRSGRSGSGSSQSDESGRGIENRSPNSKKGTNKITKTQLEARFTELVLAFHHEYNTHQLTKTRLKQIEKYVV